MATKDKLDKVSQKDNINSCENEETFNDVYKSLINNTDDLIWSVSNDFKLIAFNDAYGEIIENFTHKKPEIGEFILAESFGDELTQIWSLYYKRGLAGEPNM